MFGLPVFFLTTAQNEVGIAQLKLCQPNRGGFQVIQKANKQQVNSCLFHLHCPLYLTVVSMQKSPNFHFKIFFSFLALSYGHAEAFAQQKLPELQLNAGMHVIRAEVAATEAQRQQGLMFRQSMGANEGMLFVFERPAGVCMWMKNTPLPLSVAFIDGEGKIINIEDMQPNTTDSHCAKKLIRYALEMNQGWFKQRNIKEGSTIQGLPK